MLTAVIAAGVQLMGGRFRNLMPSNLLHPGACAVESLPAPGNEYASQMAKGELRRLFKRCAPPPAHLCLCTSCQEPCLVAGT